MEDTELHTVSFKLNGAVQVLQVAPRRSLTHVLDQECGMKSARVGCGQGDCGSCTVSVDGVPIRGCLLFAVQADGADIRTAEALADPAMLAAIRKAFKKHRAIQCGYCTPGFMILAEYILRNALPLDQAVQTLSANLCRCTGYSPIVSAVTELLASRAENGCGP